MSTTTLETPAWLMRSIATYDAKEGRLKLDHGRLSFHERGEESPLFDVALAEVSNVKFPSYNFGSVVRFDAAGERYRLAFMASRRKSKWTGASFSDIRPARRWGKEWKAVFEG